MTIKVTSGDSITDEDANKWSDMEMAIMDIFMEDDTGASDALNILTHASCRIAVLAEVPLEDLLEGVRQTYEHTAATIDFTGEIQ